MAARDRQKSYANKRRKLLKFSAGDYVLLKVSPWKGVVRFGKKEKLTPRFVRPFEIIESVGLVAYRLRLSEEMDGVLRMISEVVLQVLADHKSILYGLRSERFGVEFCVEFKYLRIVVLRLRLLFYCTPPATVDVAIPDPTLEDLAAGMPKSDDDEDACVEIPLITPIRSAVVIPFEGNRSGGSAAPTAEGPSTRDSRGKGIMTHVAEASSWAAGRLCLLLDLILFCDLVGGMPFIGTSFHFSPSPYYAAYLADGIAGNSSLGRKEFECSTPVYPPALSTDQLTAKMMFSIASMVSHGENFWLDTGAGSNPLHDLCLDLLILG
ncbi:hypothetical protein Tco_0111336 [Tanacetum coccineum]